ncbi:DUF3099 domain-containing protein [Herbiconiux ginsengi]|uniref:DUF3099 domain-containing protein n=1 Tax=Herbiconiux ginsengi TaxID=381665 RepID=A0A1H3PWX5_9MICO|nr:DUF3099 domain-containing protein [Herbiconiux ginsengi]SDZ05428.1 Protein of unknown function [Herbiconiux ginsengi]
MRHAPQSVTSIPRSPEDERRSRMTKYLVTMGIRIVCLVLMLFVQGWWLAVCAAGAILLPYFAVVLGNVGTSWVSHAERPTAIEVYRRPVPPVAPGDGSTAAAAAPNTEEPRP